MTALTPGSQIPTSVNTDTKLAAWVGLMLANMYPSLQAVEGQGFSELAAQAGVYYVRSENKHRLICRQSILMDPLYLAGGAKLWTFTQEFGSVVIPAAFTSN